MNHNSPFLIVGCGRSGTTLLRSMLNRHPNLALPLETFCIIDYLKLSEWVEVDRFWHLFACEHEVSEWQVPLPPEAVEYSGSIGDRIARFHREALLGDGEAFAFWGQKTPRFIRHLDRFLEQWPDARIIHVIRDPRAVVSSLIRSEVHRSNALFGAWRWYSDVQNGLMFGATHPQNYCQIGYEELVRRPRETLEIVCAFLGVPFDPVVFDYQAGAKEEYSSSYYKRVHAKLWSSPDTGNIEKWQKELSSNEVALIEHICREQMLALGYKCIATHQGFLFLTTVTCLVERPIGLCRQVLHMLTTRFGYFFSWMRRKAYFFLLRAMATVVPRYRRRGD